MVQQGGVVHTAAYITHRTLYNTYIYIPASLAESGASGERE